MAYGRHFFLWDLLTQVRRCLWCGGIDVHPSTHPLRLLTVFHWKTWRCHRCGRRFPLRPSQETTPPEFAEAVRRRRPAGEALRPLDDALADVLKPPPSEEAGAEAAPATAAEPRPPTPRADEQS